MRTRETRHDRRRPAVRGRRYDPRHVVAYHLGNSRLFVYMRIWTCRERLGLAGHGRGYAFRQSLVVVQRSISVVWGLVAGCVVPTRNC